jgi:hypothetical protein
VEVEVIDVCLRLDRLASVESLRESAPVGPSRAIVSDRLHRVESFTNGCVAAETHITKGLGDKITESVLRGSGRSLEI